MNELRFVSSVEKPHLIFITETWFNQYSVPKIDNYYCYRKDREDKNKGGGVCIFVKNDIKSSEVCSNQLKKTEVEQIWCNINTGDENLLVGCIYRPEKIKKDGITQPKHIHSMREAETTSIIKNYYYLTNMTY